MMEIRKYHSSAIGSHQKSVAGCLIFSLVALCYCLSSNIFVDGHSISNRKIKTIVSDDGDVIECVDIYKQPAFHHPLLKNHTIQMKPSSYPSGWKAAAANIHHKNNNKEVDWQGWLKNGRCPKGTIPIVTTQTQTQTLPQKAHPPRTTPFVPQGTVDSQPHEYAQVSILDGNYYGAQASINAWSPTVAVDQEFSIAQIWVLAGTGNNFNSLEAGYMVTTARKQATFFIYWTRDNYQSTGCYNLQCPGFVQVTPKVTFGGTIHPLSTYGGDQYEINVTIHKDMETGNWWLHFQDTEVGYWPSSILTSLSESSTAITWGGEIVNSNPQGHHTSTQMGSGHFPSEGFRRASFIRNIHYVDGSGVLQSAGNLVPYVSKPACYDLQVKDFTVADGTHFFYGGPGFSDKCG